jgi:hypothetical protein
MTICNSAQDESVFGRLPSSTAASDAVRRA